MELHRRRSVLLHMTNNGRRLGRAWITRSLLTTSSLDAPKTCLEDTPASFVSAEASDSTPATEATAVVLVAALRVLVAEEDCVCCSSAHNGCGLSARQDHALIVRRNGSRMILAKINILLT